MGVDTYMGGPQQQLEYSDWWGQVGMIGGGGLLPVHWDSVTGKGWGRVGGGGGKWGSMQSMVSPLFHCASMGYIWVTVSIVVMVNDQFND